MRGSRNRSFDLSNIESRINEAGELKKLVANIYTTSIQEDEGVLLRRNFYVILGMFYSGGVMSHRSAMEAGPKDENIVLTYVYTKKIKLPGMIVHLMKGPGALDGDMPFVGGLYIASPERAWLENLRSTKAHGFRKTLTPESLELQLDEDIRVHGEEKFRESISRTHRLGALDAFRSELEPFQRLTGALLGTRTKDGLVIRNKSKPRFVAGALVLSSLLSCATLKFDSSQISPLILVGSNCIANDVPTSKTLILKVCNVKNTSKITEQVQFSPEFSEGDKVSSPSSAEIENVKSEIEKRPIILPNGTPTVSGDRPETFIFSALVMIFSAASKSGAGIVDSQSPSNELKSNESKKFAFLAKRKEGTVPDSIKLKFRKPFSKAIIVPLIRDSA